jgi:protein-S-isoprenylcysteine O-methyltransferase Ste14
VRYLEHRIPPPIVVLIVASAMWVMAGRSQIWPAPTTLHLSISVILLVIGIGVALSAVVSFRRASTTVNPLKPETSTSLVSTGIFARSRNPMYLGMLISLVGWAVYLASFLALLGPLLFGLYITRFQIIPEEKAMQSLFGAEFERYSEQVRRWL